MIETDLNNNRISNRTIDKLKCNLNKEDNESKSKCLIDQHVDEEELNDLLSNSKETSIIDNTPNSTTVAANLLIDTNTSPVTAIESAITVNSMSSTLINMDQASPNQSTLLDESNGDELDFDDNSLTNVTQCFNIKTEPDENQLLNETGK